MYCINFCHSVFTFTNVHFFVNLQEIWLLENGYSCTGNVAENFLIKVNEFVVTTVIFYFTWIITFENDLLNWEIKSKHFLKKFLKFTNNSFRIVLTSKAGDILSLFPLNDYKWCVIYKEDYFCGSRYFDESKRNADVRWNEHNNPTKSSEPSKYF